MSQTFAQLINGKSATVEFSTGSASTPSVAFSGDTNTGIYSPGADQVAISTNGTGRLFINSSGSVGVNTSSPAAGFDVNNNAYTRGGHKVSGYFATSAGDGYVINIGSAGTVNYIQSLNGATQSQLSIDGSPIVFRGASFTEIARFDTAGRLGVGTATPSFRVDTTVSTNGFDGYNAYGGNGGASEFIGYRAINPNSVGLIAGVSGFSATGAISGANLPAVYTLGNVSLAFGTNSVERMRLTSTGLGIGTTNPQTTLHVKTATDNNLYVGPLGGAGTGVYLATVNDAGSLNVPLQIGNASQINFAINGTEAARIDSSRRLLVGTSSAPTGTNSQYSKHVIQGNTFDGSGSARMAMRVGVGASSLSSGSGIADIYFVDSGAGEYARIGCEADAQAGTNDYPGRLVFSTTADGASSPTERLRIANDGSISSVIPGGSTLYPRFGCRAWVNFNGTGTVAIRASGNVSSITDNGVGDYTVNLTTAMPDANYSIVGMSRRSSGADPNTGYGAIVSLSASTTPTASSARVWTVDAQNASGAASVIVLADQSYINVAIFR